MNQSDSKSIKCNPPHRTLIPVETVWSPFTCIPSVPAKVIVPFNKKSVDLKSIKRTDVKTREQNVHEDRGYPYPTLVMVQMSASINVGMIPPTGHKRQLENQSTNNNIVVEQSACYETMITTTNESSSVSLPGRKERRFKRRKSEKTRLDQSSSSSSSSSSKRHTPTYKLESREDEGRGLGLYSSESSSNKVVIRGSCLSSGESKDTLFNNLGDIEQLRVLIKRRQRRLRKSPGMVMNLIEVTERLAIAVENLNTLLAGNNSTVEQSNDNIAVSNNSIVPTNSIAFPIELIV